jgi:hypothetical protein
MADSPVLRPTLLEESVVYQKTLKAAAEQVSHVTTDFCFGHLPPGGG